MSDLNLKLVITATNDGAIRSVNQLEQAIRGVGPSARSAIADLAHISGAIALWQQFAASPVEAVRAFARAAEELKGVEARVKLASGSLVEFKDNLDAIRSTARDSGTEVVNVAALFTRIATPIKDMGGSAKDAQQAVTAVGQALLVSGASAAESSAAMLQFAQALGSGVLRGEELSSILENAPRLAQAIAAGLGVTVGELKKLGEQGALTSQQVLMALQSQQAALAGEAARLPRTVGQAWTNLGEAVKQTAGEMDNALGVTANLAGGLNGLAANLPAIAAGLGQIALIGAAAFGANRVAAIGALVAAKGRDAATTRVAAAEELRHAEAATASLLAVRQGAIAQLNAATAAQGYAVSSQAAALADEKRSAAARLLWANQSLVAAGTAQAAAQAAVAAANVGAMGRAMGLAATAGRGLLALFGGWPGLVITGITAAALAWDHFRNKGQQAAQGTALSTEQMIRNFEDFAAKNGPAEQADQLSKLKSRAAELRDQLLSPAFRMSDVGRAAEAELRILEAAVGRADEAAKAFVNNRGQERGLLGLDKLKLDAGGLVDQDSLKSLQAFETLYKDFVAGALNDNGVLKASALELKTALQGLFSAAKTPAAFTGLVERISTALGRAPKDATLRSQLENAIEARSQAEMRALNGLVAGLEARAGRIQALFSQTAGVALAQFNQAAALARVAAELRNDPAGVAQVEVASRNAEVAAAQAGAGQQLAALEQVAARKRQLVTQGAADVLAQANAEIAAVRNANEAKIAIARKEVEEKKRSAASLKDITEALRQGELEKTQGAAAARVQAEGSAARQLRAIDAEAAQQRAAIAQGLYDTLKSRAGEALQAYKTYAQQVIDLDKQIVNNRLNTAAAINALRRQDMTPKEQAEDLRKEMTQLKLEASNAQAEGKSDLAKDLLQRQQGVAQSIGNLSGEGVDPKTQRQEAISELSRIGRETDGILQEQKGAAEAAAAKQLEQFNQMTQAMNGLAQQITKLNEQAAIRLKPEIDQGALSAALEAVKSAFAGLVLPVKVQATGLPDGATATPPALPAFASGGPLPGTAPHDRADNMLYWGTPGEWVMQLPAVRHYGADFMRRLNAMQIPRYADGGALSRLRIPSLPAPTGRGSTPTPVNVHLDGRRYPMAAAPDVVAEMVSALGREALKRGARR